MSSPFKQKCDRCGEMYFEGDHKVFKVSYETMGYVSRVTDKAEPKKVWRTLYLCPDCQSELRAEFYRRGMMHHDS